MILVTTIFSIPAELSIKYQINVEVESLRSKTIFCIAFKFCTLPFTFYQIILFQDLKKCGLMLNREAEKAEKKNCNSASTWFYGSVEPPTPTVWF